MNHFLIIIPSYNEEQNLGKVLEGLLSMGLPADILVVDDGSADQTAEIAARYPVTVVSHPYNLGYGAALQTGFMYARERNYRYVVQFDADGQHNPQDLPAIMNELMQEDVEIVMGSRFMENSSDYQLGALKKLGIKFFRGLIYSLTGTKISDPTSGLRGVSEKVYRYYAGWDCFPADYPDADILIQMILRRYRIREIPAHMRIREAGISMHAGIKPLFYMMKISLCILIVLLRHTLSKRVSNYE